MFKLLPDSSNGSLPQTIDNVPQVIETQEPEDKFIIPAKFTKLNHDLIAMIHSYIKTGASIKNSCLLCGIAPSTFYTWKKKAKDAKSGIYLDFFNSVELAQAKHQQYYINIVHHTVVHSPRDALEVLKSKYPEEWGRKASMDQMDMDGDKDATEITIKIHKGEQNGND